MNIIKSCENNLASNQYEAATMIRQLMLHENYAEPYM